MVGEERGNTGGTRDSVIDGEFGKREPFHPLLLRVVDIVAKVLLKVCIGNLSLAIGFWVIGRERSIETRRRWQTAFQNS